MSENTRVIDTNEVKAGDKVRVTFNSKGADYTITGLVEDWYGDLAVGGWAFTFMDDLTIERFEPDWTKARVILLNCCDSAYYLVRDGKSWRYVFPSGLGAQRHEGHVRNAPGTITVIVDELGNLIGGDHD